MWTALGRTAEVYMIANDDVRFETQGWDEVLRAEVAKYPDGILLACPYDPVAPAIATFPIIGWGWLNTMGRVYAGYFHYWYDDKWVDQIGRMVGRYINIPDPAFADPRQRPHPAHALPAVLDEILPTDPARETRDRHETDQRHVSQGRKGPRRRPGKDAGGGRQL